MVTSVMVLGLATYRNRRSARRLEGCRRRAGPEPARQARGHGERSADPGDRPAVDVDLPLPRLRRSRDDAARAPRQPRGSSSTSPRSTSIHSFWAYRARGQGGRGARRRQRRVREAAEDRRLPGPLRGALRPLARAHEHDRAGRDAGPLQRLDRADGQASTPASPSTCRRTPSSTTRSHSGERPDHGSSFEFP